MKPKKNLKHWLSRSLCFSPSMLRCLSLPFRLCPMMLSMLCTKHYCIWIDPVCLAFGLCVRNPSGSSASFIQSIMANVDIEFVDSWNREMGENDGAMTFEEACVHVNGQKLNGPLRKPLKSDHQREQVGAIRRHHSECASWCLCKLLGQHCLQSLCAGQIQRSTRSTTTHFRTQRAIQHADLYASFLESSRWSAVLLPHLQAHLHASDQAH